MSLVSPKLFTVWGHKDRIKRTNTCWYTHNTHPHVSSYPTSPSHSYVFPYGPLAHWSHVLYHELVHPGDTVLWP